MTPTRPASAAALDAAPKPGLATCHPRIAHRAAALAGSQKTRAGVAGTATRRGYGFAAAGAEAGGLEAGGANPRPGRGGSAGMSGTGRTS